MSKTSRASMAATSAKQKQGFYARYVKRILDIFFSLLLLVCLSWLFIIVAILVRLNFGSPVIFKQDRPGLNGNVFKMYKFKTMLPPQTREGRVITDSERLDCLEKGIDVLSDEERLTKFGRVLRALSIDELPELFNILKGDMSFVGPRPLAIIYLPYYTAEEMKRHDVRPGLTGLAQINGRNSVQWSERFSYDLEYAEHVSFIRDMKILLATVRVVLTHDDVAQGAERPEAFHEVRLREIEEGLVSISDLPAYCEYRQRKQREGLE